MGAVCPQVKEEKTKADGNSRTLTRSHNQWVGKPGLLTPEPFPVGHPSNSLTCLKQEHSRNQVPNLTSSYMKSFSLLAAKIWFSWTIPPPPLHGGHNEMFLLVKATQNFVPVGHQFNARFGRTEKSVHCESKVPHWLFFIREPFSLSNSLAAVMVTG